MVKENLSEAEIRRGYRMRRTANFLCKLRIAAAPLVFAYTVKHPEYQSWAFGGLMGGLQATDKLDGYLGREGSAILGEDTTPEGARLDQQSDKTLMHATLGGLALREMMNSTYGLGLFYATNQVVAGIRDWRVNRWRNIGDEHGIDTKARPYGKWKTAVYGAALTAATSPLVHMEVDGVPVGEYAVGAGLATGTALAIVSGIDNVRNIRRQLPSPAASDPAEMQAA